MSRPKLSPEAKANYLAERRRQIHASRNAMNREAAAGKKAGGIVLGFGKPPAPDLMARLAEIPADTRDLTSRICGDPIFERSALYRRQQCAK